MNVYNKTPSDAMQMILILVMDEFQYLIMYRGRKK